MNDLHFIKQHPSGQIFLKRGEQLLAEFYRSVPEEFSMIPFKEDVIDKFEFPVNETDYEEFAKNMLDRGWDWVFYNHEEECIITGMGELPTYNDYLDCWERWARGSHRSFFIPIKRTSIKKIDLSEKDTLLQKVTN